MENQTPRSIPHPKRAAKKQPDKKIIIIIIAVALIAAVTVGGIFLAKHLKNKKAAEAFVPVDATQEITDGESTDPIGEATTSGGDVSQEMNKIMYATASTLNVRKAPSTDSEVVAKYAKGNEVKVTGKYNDDWYIVDAGGIKGYCSAKYLADTKDGGTTAGSGVTKAPVQPNQQNDNPYLLKVNRKQNIVIAYTKDSDGEYTKPYKAMVCSVGLDGKTPTGTFSTTNKYTWRLLSGNVYGQYATRIDGPILFHSVPYFTQNKADLEYEEYNKLGQAASLGCVRLAVIDAKWIYDNCPKGTTVVIYDSDEKEPLSKPTPIKIDLNSANKKWDPTDPDKNNPWNS